MESLMQTQKSKIVNLAVVLLMLLPWPRLAEGQQPGKVPRIGYLTAGGDLNTPGPEVETFRQGLRDLGYIEGKNVAIEYRGAEGKQDRIPGLVSELVQIKVDVLVITSLPAIRAAKQATQTIPIVMVTTVDPVATGLIDSLARPGGNITGLTRLTRDLSGKRLELLTEVVPKISRIAVLWEEDIPGPAISLKEYEVAASAFKLTLQSLAVRSSSPDLEGAFQAAAKARAGAFLTVFGPVLGRYAKPIADLCIRNRLPSMYERVDFVEAGDLVSYTANDSDNFRRAATFVDKILKGTKPADLPVEQPMKFELVINLRTAKQIALTIPPNVLARADKVIR
jgi:putative tryptophan/tyrosine transport system substrate-binding protein